MEQVVRMPNQNVRVKVLADMAFPGTGLLRDFILILSFALFTTLLAQIAIRIPTTTVPITGQTLGVLLTGASLGARRGAASMILYMLLGMFVFNAFAPPGSLMGDKTLHFILPWSGTQGFIWDLSSGGYIVGFILGSYVVGFLAERGWDRHSTLPIAMVIANLSIYVVGLPWLGYFIASGTLIPGLELSYYDAISGTNVLDKTLKGGLYPFIGGDALKLLVASSTVPIAWLGLKKFKGEDSSS